MRSLLLLILDGWGYSSETENNAIALANTPVWDKLWANYPHTLISCSGLDVGLPRGQIGNSEVGHMTMGAGRVVYQDLTRINLAIEQSEFARNPALNKFINAAHRANQALHIMGLLSPGGVHAHETHFYAVLELCAKLGITKVYLHAFLDGRDTPPASAEASLVALQQRCQQLGVGEIVSICGRFYAMDRDHRFDRTQAAYELLMSAQAEYIAADPISALQQAYARGETDEFVSPTLILTKNGAKICIADQDYLLFMNFRADRARQLCYAFTQPQFTGFTRGDNANKQLHLATFTEYAADLIAAVIFTKPNLTNTLGSCLQQHNLSQLRIAETEKYAHVTFFFNAGNEQAFANEHRILIPSPKITTYDAKPEMSVYQITAELVQAITNKTYDVIICNFANADMVGHTGNLAATIAAVEAIDVCLGKITAALLAVGGEALITADHGNAEQMYDPAVNQAHTAHTTSLVPLIYIGQRNIRLKSGAASLADIAPSLLNLLAIAIPTEMTGKSLIEFN